MTDRLIFPCPDDDAIQSFVEGTLAPAAREVLAEHLDACDECRALLGDLSLTAEEPRADEEPRRYVALSTLGAGGMGMVQAAFDKQLGRKVALKFLVGEPGLEAQRATARLQREAMALAKLSHPNVVTVHDVGVLDGEVFVAMELVEGATLRAWLAAKKRSLPEIVGALLQAGEGLAAAHAVGLLHLDFKPDNVLVGDDGRVRVTDFGLARAFSDGARLERTEGALEQGASGNLTLTRAGVRAGTPAYMAPEQRLGHEATERSDVYAFCITLHEAVTGQRPSGDDSALRARRRGSSASSRAGSASDPRSVGHRCARSSRRSHVAHASRRRESRRSVDSWCLRLCLFLW